MRRRSLLGVVRRLLFGLLLLAGSPVLYAQPNRLHSGSNEAPWVPPVHELWQETVALARAPGALSSTDVKLTASATGLLVGIAAVLDEPAYRHLSERPGTENASVARRATASMARPGEWYDQQKANRLAFSTVGLLAGSGLVLQRPALTRTATRTLMAIVYTDAASGLVKSVLNRSRPYVGPEPDAFSVAPGAFNSAHTELAMPSGHAARVFAIASVLSHEANRWYVSVPLYAGASSVALERVRSGDHWLTDVIVGSAIGYAVGRSVASNSELTATAHDALTFTPILSRGHVGLSVQF